MGGLVISFSPFRKPFKGTYMSRWGLRGGCEGAAAGADVVMRYACRTSGFRKAWQREDGRDGARPRLTLTHLTHSPYGALVWRSASARLRHSVISPEGEKNSSREVLRRRMCERERERRTEIPSPAV